MHMVRGTYPTNADKHAGMTKAAYVCMAVVMTQFSYNARLDNEHMVYRVTNLV